MAKDNPKTNGQLDLRQRAAAAQYVHRPATAPDRLRDARRGHRRPAHRVRERDEHAVRPRRLAREGTGDSRRARRDPLAARSANDDGEFPRRADGRGRRRADGALGGWPARPRHERSAIPAALLGLSSRSTAKFSPSPSASFWWRRSSPVSFRRLLSARANAAEMMKEGGRGNSSRLVNVITRVLVVGQIALTAALLIAATLADQIDPQPDDAELRLRRKRRLQRAHGS